MAGRIDFHPEHLALGWEAFSKLFKHLPEQIVAKAWKEANPKSKKFDKKK